MDRCLHCIIICIVRESMDHPDFDTESVKKMMWFRWLGVLTRVTAIWAHRRRELWTPLSWQGSPITTSSSRHDAMSLNCENFWNLASSQLLSVVHHPGWGRGWAMGGHAEVRRQAPRPRLRQLPGEVKDPSAPTVWRSMITKLPSHLFCDVILSLSACSSWTSPRSWRGARRRSRRSRRSRSPRSWRSPSSTRPPSSSAS